MGDVIFKGFQCLNPACTEYIFVRKNEISTDFTIICPACGYSHESGGETKFYDYSVDVEDEQGNWNSVAKGEFSQICRLYGRSNQIAQPHIKRYRF